MAAAFMETFLENFTKQDLDEFFWKFFKKEYTINYKIGKTKQDEPYFVATVTNHSNNLGTYKFNAFSFSADSQQTSVFDEFSLMQKAWIKYVASKNKDVEINGVPYEKALENYYYNLYISKALKKEKEIKAVLSENEEELAR